MPAMPFEDFAALVAGGFKPQLVEPVAENMRRLIRERMPAALEYQQYGASGAGEDDEILPTFKADYNSEIGIFLSNFPVLMVIPLGGEGTAQNLYTQAHEIYVLIEIARNVTAANASVESNQLTKDLHVYARALHMILLNLKPEELIEGMPKAGGCGWDIGKPDYNLFRRNERGTMFRRGVSLIVTVGVSER